MITLAVTVIFGLLAKSTPSPLPMASACPPSPVKLIKDASLPTTSAYLAAVRAALDAHGSVSVDIDVRVTAQGTATRVSVKKASGYPALDLRAVQDARKSKYKARTVHCQPLAGTYSFTMVWGTTE